MALGILNFGVHLKFLTAMLSSLFSALFILFGVAIAMGEIRTILLVFFAIVSLSYGILGFYSIFIALSKRNETEFRILKYASLLFLFVFTLACFDAGMVSGLEFSIIFVSAIFLLLNWLSIKSIAKSSKQNA